MAQPTFPFDGLGNLFARKAVFLKLRHKWEHDRQRPAIRRPDQRLQLHTHHTRFIQPHPDRAPAECRVRLIGGLHVGQNFIRADIERAEDHPLTARCLKNALIEAHQFRAFRHLVAYEELQLGAKQAHAFGARVIQRRQIGHQTCVHQQVNPLPVGGYGRLLTYGGIALLRLCLHGDLVTKGADDGIIGAQMHHAIVPIDQHMITVQTLCRDARRAHHQRNRQRPCHNRRMRANGTFLKDDPLELAAIFQQFRRADIAGHQNGVFRQLSASVLALTCQNAQQAVREIIQIAQAFAQIGVLYLRHTATGEGLLFFHRSLGAEATRNVFFHAPHPALGVGKHPIGFKNLRLLLIPAGGHL